MFLFSLDAGESASNFGITVSLKLERR